MGDYYLYLFDSKGAIRRRLDLTECRDDDHARDLAAAHPYRAAMELWQRGRLVERFAAAGQATVGAPPGDDRRAVYVVDHDLRFLSANARALEYWGKGPGEVIGRSLPDAFPSVVGSVPYQAHLQTLSSRRPFHTIVRSPVLAEAIDLEIHPHQDGLRVTFLKLHDTLPPPRPAAA